MIIHTISAQEFKNYRATTQIFYTYHRISAGLLLVLAAEKGIFEASFVEHETNLPGLIKVDNLDFNRLLLVGTEFQVNVWRSALAIPAGTTAHYSDLAQALGQPTAHRAVANALGKNNIVYFVPCHRILRKDGNMGGFRWGIERKKKLLEAE